jgi:hypothetical protein
MFGIPVRVPFVFVMLLAGLWVFALAWWKPELLNQNRASRFYTSILEGILCGTFWGLLLALQNDVPLAGIVLSSILVGLFWFGVVLYSRQQYPKNASETGYVIHNSVERRH